MKAYILNIPVEDFKDFFKKILTFETFKSLFKNLSLLISLVIGCITFIPAVETAELRWEWLRYFLEFGVLFIPLFAYYGWEAFLEISSLKTENDVLKVKVKILEQKVQDNDRWAMEWITRLIKRVDDLESNKNDHNPQP